MKPNEPIYKELIINSRNLEVPREAYQRELNMTHVHRIASEFDEHIANEPKVSMRNGHYYVFDGQHTIAARKQRNKGQDLPILCKVYYGMTEADEALLFAQQTGASAVLTAGARIRALIYAGDPEATAFLRATEATGMGLDYTNTRGVKRLACISTAFTEFQKVGAERYMEALNVLLGLVRRCRGFDPLKIYRDGRAMTISMPGFKKYTYQVLAIYNGSSQKTALPLKF